MSDELVLPRLSDTMEEGSIVRWLKQPGDSVERGEALVEVDTDKVTVVLEAPADGFLGEILVAEGETAKIGTTLVYVVDEPGAKSTPREPVFAPPPDAKPPPEVPEHPTRPTSVGGPVRATPLARKLAKQAGLELAALSPGSGPDGRVLRGDVDRALRANGGGDDAIEPSRLQTVLARRMTESKQQIPHYYITTNVDVTDALHLRQEARALEPTLSLSMTHLVVSSCARALAEHPYVNSAWINGKLVRHSHADVGIAVALEDDGLIVPVLRAAERLSLRELVAQIDALAERARTGRLTPAELGSGTFTVSNLGMYAVDEFHAIINPPESGILAIGAVEERPVVRDGSVVIRTVLRLSLSADHRVYSGVTAARFLNAVRERLEHPLGLFVSAE